MHPLVRRPAGLAVLMLVLPLPVHAAQALVEEIVVTAQKREQPLQEVGIAVTAFTGEQIRELGFTNSIDIVAHTPGMTFGTPTAEGNNTNLALRGVALNDFNDNNESPVAVYIDEVYVSAIAGATFQLYDIDRIEVLRGPQGTLFGRNASGGLAHFITKRPSQAFEGYLDLTLAENGQVKSEGAVNIPFSDRISARFSAAQNYYNGYVHNRVKGIHDPNNTDSNSGRAQLAIDVTDDVDVLLSYHGTRLDSRDGSWQHQSTKPMGDVNVALPADEDVWGTGRGNDIFGYRDTDGDPWAGDYDRDGPLKITNNGWTARVQWRIDPNLTLTSITANDDYARLFGEDTDVGPTPGLVPTFDSDIGQFTQEIRLAGDYEKLRWVAGLYYFESDVNGLIDFGVFSSTVPATDCRGGRCLPTQAGGVTDWALYYNAHYDQKTDSWAGFGQVEYDLSDAFTLIGGLRYTDEQRELELFASDLVDPELIYLDFTKRTVGQLTQNDSDNWTGKVELDFHASDDVLVYGFVARGVKAAGFNTGILDTNGILNNVTPDQVPFDEETLTSYEVGMKGTFADGLARLNLSAYYYDYQDFQAFAFANLGQIIFNTDATVNGAEAELTLVPTDRFEALFGVGWINDAEAKDIKSFTGRLRDRRMVLAPEWQLNTILRYSWPLAAGGSIAAQWDGFYQTKQYFDIQNHPISESDAYSVWNAKLSYDSADGKWTVTGWVNNVFDEEYLVYTFDFTNSFGFNQQAYGRPRWMGLTASYRW